ncbi:MAG: ErpA-related iron-sulfur cluster insertion protein [Desulfovibrionaceae bacterium]
MFSVELSEDAVALLKLTVQKEGEGFGMRIFQYQTGTPCCRKTLLGVTPDKKDGLHDDVESMQSGIQFIAEQEVLDQYGDKFSITLNEHNMPDVVAC